MTRLMLEKELQTLKNLIIDMAKNVDDLVHEVLVAMEKLDEELAKKVISADDDIDSYEHLVSQTALEVIARQQPVAKDLRFVITAIDIARNLERTADQAVNIAFRVKNLASSPERPRCSVEVENMANEALYMLHSAINAFVTESTEKARAVIDYDNVVDKLQNSLIQKVKKQMQEHPELIESGIDYIIVIQNLERIADLATNIAEGVIFTAEGKIVKLEETKEREIKQIKELIFKDIPIFDYLRKHAHLVLECVERLSLSLEAYYTKNQSRLEEIAKHIFEIEKEADKLKQNIRGHLPRGVVLPVEKFELFLYLKEQDAIADVAEEIINWLSFKTVELPENLFQEVDTLLTKSIEPLKYLEDMIVFSAEFLNTKNEESRNSAKELIRKIRYAQYLAEEYGNQVKKDIFKHLEDPLPLFYSLKLVDLILGIAHHAENTADLMRAMIAR